jgi:hypothetical protein
VFPSLYFSQFFLFLSQRFIQILFPLHTLPKSWFSLIDLYKSCLSLKAFYKILFANLVLLLKYLGFNLLAFKVLFGVCVNFDSFLRCNQFNRTLEVLRKRHTWRF